MPTFNAQSPNLVQDGPVVDIHLSVPNSVAVSLQQSGQPVPPPIQVAALIDTGATMCTVQQGLPALLQLNPVGIIPTTTPSSMNVPAAVYLMRLILPQGYTEILVCEMPLQGQNIQCLLGRNLLEHGVLIYNGTNNSFSLSF